MTTILFIGLGSIGKRHLNNVHSIFSKKSDGKLGKVLPLFFSPPKYIVLRNSIHQKFEHIQDVGITNVTSFEEAFSHNPEIAFICNPTIFHIESAIQAASHGCHLFIEKPLSHSMECVEKLQKIAQEKSLVVMIGCCLRFKGVIKKAKELLEQQVIGKAYHFSIDMGQYLPDWKPNEDYSKSFRSKKEFGGGPILELIHELDYARYLFGNVQSVSSIVAKQSSMEINTEDMAKILCMLSIPGTITLDYLQRFPHREIKVVGESGNLLVDLYKNKIGIERPWKEMEVLNLDEDRNNMYLEEVQHFFDCISNQKTTEIPLEEGIADLQFALDVKKYNMNSMNNMSRMNNSINNIAGMDSIAPADVGAIGEKK